MNRIWEKQSALVKISIFCVIRVLFLFYITFPDDQLQRTCHEEKIIIRKWRRNKEIRQTKRSSLGDGTDRQITGKSAVLP